MNRWIGLLMLASALAACGGKSTGITAATTHSPAALTPSPSVTVRQLSTVTLMPLLIIKEGDSSFPNFKKTGNGGCKGTGGFDDLTKGAAVTIYSATGAVVGTGYAKKALVEKKDCVMEATVYNVKKASYYKVQWADRNKIAFSLSGLENQSVYTSIG